MADELDHVARYAMAIGFAIRVRTVIVEGTTDVELCRLAAQLERKETGVELLGSDLAIVAAGEGDAGGTKGVIRELISLRSYARTCLLPNGKPKYRFIGFFDNDNAGRNAIRSTKWLDTSVLEYKDTFRLQPVMPLPGNLDPGSVQKAFERENGGFKGLDWEMEDLIAPTFFEAFASENPSALRKSISVGGKVHRELTADGKARLHRFVKQNALRTDVLEVINLLKALRFYMGVK